MVCHSEVYTYVDIVHIEYVNIIRTVSTRCHVRNVSLVHIVGRSMECFPVHLFHREERKRGVLKIHHRWSRWGVSPRHAEGRHAQAFKGRKNVKMKAISFLQWPGQMP